MTVTEPAQRPKDPDSATSDSDHPEDETSGLKRHVGASGCCSPASARSSAPAGCSARSTPRSSPGPAAIISWALGGVMILHRADLRRARHDVPAVRRRRALPAHRVRLVRELHPGWITWVVGRDVAPIEVEAALQYATKYSRLLTRAPAAAATPCTPSRSATSRPCCWRCSAGSTLRGPLVRPRQQRAGVVEARDHPAGDRRVPPHRVPRRELQQPRLRPLGQRTACSPRSRPPASCSPTSASARASSSPARPTTRGATCPSP